MLDLVAQFQENEKRFNSGYKTSPPKSDPAKRNLRKRQYLKRLEKIMNKPTV